MRRLICFILLLMLLMPSVCAEKKYTAFPECLRITQKREKSDLSSSSYSMRHYPKTCRKEINEELKTLIDQMSAENLPYLPRKSALSSESAMLDTGATVYRTGDRWASFLIVSTVINGTKQLRMTFDSRAYDMQTGAQLTIEDVILPEGLPFVQQEAARQLAAAFPQYEADAEKIAALTAEEQILSADFTLSPAFLQLHFPVEALYDHEGIILHVRIPYTSLDSYLTDEARVQTDNSRYQLVALTYDDGPTRHRTISIIRSLRDGGLNATFFVVGNRIADSVDLISLEHNTGFTIASHNYEHVYPADMEGKVRLYRDKINEELHAITGSGVKMMRAPGGHEEIYIEEKVDLPLIHWTLASKDASSSNFDPKEEARRLAYAAKDGSIVLMHDLRKITSEYSAYLPQLFNDRGIMCVTVEELFLLRGIPLENNTVYINAYPTP